MLPARALHAYRMLRHVTLFPFERELRLVPHLLDRRAVAVDVGANVGVFTDVLARGSKRVIAFEPNPHCAQHLRKLGIGNCEIVEAALSDRPGRAALRMPVRAGAELHALGTLADGNPVGLQSADSVVAYPVPTTTLDDALAERLAPADTVGFIKIDVEGHEYSVLAGAGATIERHRPVFLIELEYRHGASIADVFALFARHGYEALALRNGSSLSEITADELLELQSDDLLARKLRNPRDFGYLNNVIFVPSGLRDRVLRIQA